MADKINVTVSVDVLSCFINDQKADDEKENQSHTWIFIHFSKEDLEKIYTPQEVTFSCAAAIKI